MVFESDATAVDRCREAVECFRRSVDFATAQQRSSEPEENVRRQVVPHHDRFGCDTLAHWQRLPVIERFNRDEGL